MSLAKLFIHLQEKIGRNHVICIKDADYIIFVIHENAAAEGFSGTDDATLVEWLGYPLKLIKGSYTNIKITTQEDLLFAEAIASKLD